MARAFTLDHATDAPWPLAGLSLARLKREYPDKLVAASTWVCGFCKKKGHVKSGCPAAMSPAPGPESGPAFSDSKFFSSLFSPSSLSIKPGSDLKAAICALDLEAAAIGARNPFGSMPPTSLWALRKCLGHWRAIGTPPEQLSWLAYGFRLPFLGPPPMVGFENHPGAFQYHKFVDEELAKRVQRGQFSIVPDTFAAQLHPLDVVPKSSGSFRLILDCRLINSFLPDVFFKLENLAVVPQIVARDDWMFSTDLEDAYFHIPMHPDSRKHLCFRWRGQTFCSNVLPFGLGLAPWIFTKTLRPLVRFCRSLGISMIAYLDDFLWSAEKGGVLALVDFVRALLSRLGFSVSEKKSEWTPSQILQFLGLLVNTEAHIFEVPPERVAKILAALAKLRSEFARKQKVEARALARICGHLLSVRLAVTPARIFSRALYAALNEAEAWNSKLELSQEAVQELDFWIDSLHKFNGRRMIRAPSTLYLFTDASEDGWGAHVGPTSAFGRFLPEDCAPHTSSTHRELLALLSALRSPVIRSHVRGSHVSFVLDSLASVYNVNKGGGPVPALCALVKLIWHECLELEVDATAEWVSRDKNEKADKLSRFVDMADYSLDPALFAVLDKRWGPHTVDRFASFYNFKCPRFNSRHFDPKAEACDAFTQVWSGENNFAFPPFDAIARTVEQARRDGARLTLVYPVWAAAPWHIPVSKDCVDSFPLPSAATALSLGPRSAKSTPIPDWKLCAARFDFAQTKTCGTSPRPSSSPARL